ncbi:hypothetical protein CBR_g11899 [Chara braunii]|uniref:TPM domain-containing protein n=1 Tax=Chara braunii TaxID=69332 RepID=A0A388KQG7_CHABU|nr:hypothetical protein CBR_g11899 [Chara braunii]|eukprot:GBG72320.1 hypothetical protein CBR_g11899 [Chara braunii]
MATKMAVHVALPVHLPLNRSGTAREFDVRSSLTVSDLTNAAVYSKRACSTISLSQWQSPTKVAICNPEGSRSRTLHRMKSVSWLNKGCPGCSTFTVAASRRECHRLAVSPGMGRRTDRGKTRTRSVRLSYPSVAKADPVMHMRSSRQSAPMMPSAVARNELVAAVGEQSENEDGKKETVTSRVLANAASKTAAAAMAVAVAMVLNCAGGPALARPEGVNRPDLLPPGGSPIIDIANFLSPYQETRIRDQLEKLERDTGFRLRVLAQNYPETPGRAVKKYWGVDEYTIVFVADPNTGNILNFNVGSAVDLNVPRSFWSRLQGKYGNIFYWREKGEDAAIEAAVSAIDNCLREPPGPTACAVINGPA